MLDERATAAVLAAIVTGIAWAQSHDFNLWSIGAALPTITHVSSLDISVPTLSGVASPLLADRKSLFDVQSASTASELPLANTSGNPSTISAGYRLLSGPNDHSAAYQTFTSFDTSTLAEDQTPPATCVQLSSAAPRSLPGYDLQTGLMPTGGSTASSETTDAAVNSETTDATRGTASIPARRQWGPEHPGCRRHADWIDIPYWRSDHDLCAHDRE